MAKSKKPIKKKAAPAKKKALKRTASRSTSAAPTASPAPASAGCVCVKFGQFYYCMVQKPDGSFERCPTQTRFKTLQQCQQNVCGS